MARPVLEERSDLTRRASASAQSRAIFREFGCKIFGDAAFLSSTWPPHKFRTRQEHSRKATEALQRPSKQSFLCRSVVPGPIDRRCDRSSPAFVHLHHQPVHYGDYRIGALRWAGAEGAGGTPAAKVFERSRPVRRMPDCTRLHHASPGCRSCSVS